MTTGSARTTPGAVATPAATASGISRDAVNGPDAPASTSHDSAPNAVTMRRSCWCRLALTPVSNSVIANTSDVAAMAIRKRRRRHCRSRNAMSHMALRL